ncbi:MAG: ornithine carbamoyltransferase [Firmicutes bacterium]|nr:ornithine carbamoyltransferase [Bacillota bacterium]
MAVSLRGRDFISLHDFSTEEIWQFLETARMLKLRQKAGLEDRPLVGKTLGMIFTKPSTRTRVSFEVAMVQLGGYPLFLSSQELQLRRGETIADTAQVLSRYLDGIMIRTFAHQDVLELAEAASIPVINGLTDLLHPTQVLGDLLTILEKKGRLEGLKLAYVGDGNNMAHALLHGGAKVGMHVSIASPEGYKPQPEIVAEAQADAQKTGARLEVLTDPAEAVRDADIVYTDVWASMGQEAEKESRVPIFQPYQVNSALMARAKPDAIFMHCLPARRGYDTTDEVLDGPQSVVIDEAENRLHAHKAILALLLG